VGQQQVLWTRQDKTEDAKHGKTAIIYLNPTATDFVSVIAKAIQWVG
jgi:hypothetical protein